MSRIILPEITIKSAIISHDNTLPGFGPDTTEKTVESDMPVMNGFEATKIIRRKLEYFPIMALMGNLQAKQKYLEIGN